MPSVGPSDSLPPLKRTEPEYPVVAIVGPTASGKSALSVAIAGNLGGEVVNYDSVQLYRGFDIGSGKLRDDEQKGIPHLLLGIASAGETMTAGEYRRRAQEVLASIRARRKLPVLAGGTGLYLRTLTEGLFDGPARSEESRARLRQIAARHGGDFLHRMLARLDAPAARLIHPCDTQKVIRAIEVRCVTGEAISRLQSKGRHRIPGFAFVKIGLNPVRALLYERINQRVERMFTDGILEETRSALARLKDPDGPLPTPLEALGYRQAVAVLRGDLGFSDAIRAAQTATRHYAKRQMTWFRKEAGVRWFHGFGDQDETIQRVLDYLLSLGVGDPKPGLGTSLPGQPLQFPERENP